MSGIQLRFCGILLLLTSLRAQTATGSRYILFPRGHPVSFGYMRKDVLLIGLGVTVLGIGLKYGLELVITFLAPLYFVFRVLLQFGGVDPLQAGNVVQLVLVLELTVGWISTYLFRLSDKEMTYAQQLRDYENKVMQKRLEGLAEAELEPLLEQVEEEKRCMASSEQL